MTQLDQNNTHTLRLEYMGKLHGGWWLELIDRASGGVKIMTAEKKSLFDGMTIEHALRWTSREEYKPMYKKNVM